MKQTIRILGVGLILAFILLGITNHDAKADFMIDDNLTNAVTPGEQLFNDAAHANVSTFNATVGGISGPSVTVDAVGNVDSGAGFATITPLVQGGSILTLVTFTPADETLFSDFNFRGQLLEAGDVTVTVMDDQQQTFHFTIPNANADFSRIGIISLNGETIDWVSIFNSVGFKEVKQIQFSTAEGQNPIPEPATMFLLGSGLIGLAAYGRKKFYKK